MNNETAYTRQEATAMGALSGLGGGAVAALLISCATGELFADLFLLVLLLITAPLSGIVGAMIGRQQRATIGAIVGALVVGALILLLCPPLFSRVSYLSLEMEWLQLVALGIAIGLAACSLVGGISAAILHRLFQVNHVSSAAFGASIGAILPGYLFAFVLAMLMHPTIRERLYGG